MPKNKPSVLVREDFVNLPEDQLFGWFCMVELDSCEYPDQNKYASVYRAFRRISQEELIQFLVDQEFNR